jgi:hypothetical protein
LTVPLLICLPFHGKNANGPGSNDRPDASIIEVWKEFERAPGSARVKRPHPAKVEPEI